MPNVLIAGDNNDTEIDVMAIPDGLPFGSGHTVHATVHSKHGSNSSYHGNVT
eukprot:m.157810 g.157810  ORF g.157810 m.157810 type:complete len:52 (+) comp23675_c0_seq2:1692-1847(+)